MSDMRVVVVGTGTMGAQHADALARIPGVELAGVVSASPARARAFAKQRGGEAYPTLAAALKRGRPDAVFICAPTPLHLPMVRQAAAAGVHVFCEKPLARTRRDAEAILAVVRRTGITFMVGHVLRYFPQFALMRRIVQGGELGAVSVARLSRGGKWPEGRADWYADWKRSGGPLLDLVIHDFDWLRWTFGPVIRVHARAFGTPPQGAPQAYGLTLLRFTSGVIAHVEGSWGHELPFRVRTEVAGARGLVEYDSLHPETLALHAPARRAGSQAVAVPESPLAISPYQAQDEAFLHAVRTRGPVPVPGEEALAALRISLAALESVRTGRAVRP